MVPRKRALREPVEGPAAKACRGRGDPVFRQPSCGHDNSLAPAGAPKAAEGQGSLTTLLISHPKCLEHQTAFGHPERPDRLRVITHVLEQERFADLARDEAPMASVDAILRVHPAEHYARIENTTPLVGLA